MHAALIVSAFVLAATVAARSTWSPCGLSMLSSITPLGEVGRGYRFRTTAAWFVAGAVLGGATLGAALFALTVAVTAVGTSGRTLALLAAVACGIGAAADLGLLGFQIPVLRRQVNELWLDRFRNWVYGGGFGWQIGVGFSTYVMTAGLFVLVAVAVLTASPWVAFAVGVSFGTLRGLTVLLGAPIGSVADLQAIHRRLDRLRRPVQLTVVGVLAAVALVVGVWAWWPAALAMAAMVALRLAARARRRTAPASRDLVEA
jgi:hypothetical protein